MGYTLLHELGQQLPDLVRWGNRNGKEGAKTMKIKRIAVLTVTGIIASLTLTTSSAWAHHERHFDYGPRNIYQYRPEVVVVPPAVRYGYAPPPVYYTPPQAYAPAPVSYYRPAPSYAPPPAYYGPPNRAYASLGAIAGAVAGAAIGNTLGQGNDRTAAIAIGSVVGAVIGNQMTRTR